MSSLLARTPLRVKLVAVVVVLSGLGLALSAVAATASLHGYLVDRVDAQLGQYVDRPEGRGVGCDFGGPGRRDIQTVYQFCIADGAGAGIEIAPRGTNGPALPATFPTTPTTLRGDGDDSQWRALSRSTNGVTVLYAVDLADVSETTHRLVLLEVVVGALVLLVLGGGGYVVVRRSLRPLVAVETAALAVAEGDLSRRVPESDPATELGSLSQSFNTMVSRLESSFAAQAESEAEARASEGRMRRFVGDASHELRTPLTSIRGFAELYRSGALPSGPDVDRAMSRIEGEASRMGLLVEDLLLLARLDQQRPLERAPVDVLELVTDAVHDARAVDPSRSVQLEVVAGGAPPVVLGDAARLRQVLGNLVGNALTHTTSDVVVRLSTVSGSVVVDVVDSGPGIPAGDRERVFERFFRTDSSRTRASGGSGLGLSIVAALVAAHGGQVEALETPGGGSTFRVTVPLSTGS